MTSNPKVAVVTGSSSGIGREIALILARNKFTTYATMKNLQKSSQLKSIVAEEEGGGLLQSLRFVELDVTDDNSVRTAIQTIYNESGKIDVLVNNAGYALSGAFEDLSIGEIKQQFETNVFGVIRTTQAVLPIMRKQKEGIIVNISSGAGRFGVPALSAYVSSKFAVEGVSESMSYELEPFGIRTIIIEPGVIKTNFNNATVVAEKSHDPNSLYTPLIKARENSIKRLIANGSNPQYAAEVVLDAITDNNPKLRDLVGNDLEGWMEAKEKMSDEEFIEMMKQR